MNKEQLAKLVLTEGQLKDVDYALPQRFVNEMSDKGVDVRQTFVWEYFNNMLGSPLDLGKLFVEKYSNAPELIELCDKFITNLNKNNPDYVMKIKSWRIENKKNISFIEQIEKLLKQFK